MLKYRLVVAAFGAPMIKKLGSGMIYQWLSAARANAKQVFTDKHVDYTRPGLPASSSFSREKSHA